MCSGLRAYKTYSSGLQSREDKRVNEMGCERPQAAMPSFAPRRIAVNPGPFREQQKGTDTFPT
jgi:hypothetical protein